MCALHYNPSEKNQGHSGPSVEGRLQATGTIHHHKLVSDHPGLALVAMTTRNPSENQNKSKKPKGPGQNPSKTLQKTKKTKKNKDLKEMGPAGTLRRWFLANVWFF